jgi:lipoprotein-anchoring transpeptidase ErfK/SrfK
VTEAVKAALTEELSDTLNVSECYVTAQVTSEDKGLNQALNQANTWTSADIEYDWNGSKVLVDADVIKDWISFEEESGKIKAVLDEDAIGAFVKENAKANDTYGKKRKFTTTLGTELTLPGGAYGWKTDTAAETEALIASIKKGETASAREPEYASRGANKGSEDIGTSYVEIDLTNQHLYLYEEGEIVLETDFVSGNMSNGNYTPQGVFGITYKTKNAVLRGADYATPVNYWMPFNGNVGMHDATWRSSFGGDIYLTSGSHGCVNLPLDKAAEIYEYMSAGFPVICYYY